MKCKVWFFELMLVFMLPSISFSPSFSKDVQKSISAYKTKRCELLKYVVGNHKEEIISTIIKYVEKDEYIHNTIQVQKLLIVMANKESSGNPKAVSRKGAVGVWQIMPSEATFYGFTVDEMFSIEKNLIVAKKILYRKARKVKNPWNAVKYYNGKGIKAHNYMRMVQREYNLVTKESS